PGYLPGPNPILMVGGHYDTVHSAPGANDDGTGVAGALELARVMSEYEWPLDIYFGFWNAEEIGLFGSREVARIFVEQEIDILAYYNIDMLFVEDIHAAPDERVHLAYGKEAVHLAELTRMMSNNHGRNLIRPTRSSDFSGWGRSDHASFIAEGYERSLFAFESGFSRDSAYHTPEDTWDNPMYNYTVAREAVAAIGGAMAFIQGRAFSEPIHTELLTGFRDGGRDRLYIEAASGSTLDIWAGWNNGGFGFELYDPLDVLIESVEYFEPSSDTKPIFNVELNKSGLYSIVVSTESDGISRVNIVAEYDTDVEADGILDSEQFWLENNLFALDDDEDGLSNGLEIIYGTSISNSDSDEDSIPDFWEVENGLDPLYNDAQSDLDHDGLSNLLEYEIGTSPEKSDSDTDMMPDAWEYEYGLDPTIDDGTEDLDNDLLSNLQEYEIGTYPNNSDSDSDSLDDYSEHILYGTSPLCGDSDQDEMPDAWEVRYSLDPLLNDSGLDPDGDMLSNLEE
ncbi:MAG: M20/M25/M40 family metallo-hydrolase, partial [Candidatus Thorarchaeota archaeon]